MDIKFIEGMKLYAKLWTGKVSCLLRRGASSIPFGMTVEPEDLNFGIELIDADTALTDAHISNCDIVLGAGDSHWTLNLMELCKRKGVKCVITIEYILETRLQIVWLNKRNWLKKLYSSFWNLNVERKRRRLLRTAHGIQANGYPAFEAYGRNRPNTLLYLDNRLHAGLFATADEMAARQERLLSGAPLRLINSGRLEPMKGAQDLIPIATALRRYGMAFELHIYGTGSLEAAIRDGIAKNDLQKNVFLHAPVDFETVLVPLSRQRMDIFLSCHRQSDPSCTYIESMGCGLPIIGYENRMLSSLNAAGNIGWTAPLGAKNKLSEEIISVNRDRKNLSETSKNALYFAIQHDFYKTFNKRVQQLKYTLNF
ncbi:MAG: glycosyltransferase [Pseudomonadota bacterium]